MWGESRLGQQVGRGANGAATGAGGRTWSGSRGGGGPVNHALIAFNKVFKKVLPDSFSKEPRMLGRSLFIG